MFKHVFNIGRASVHVVIERQTVNVENNRHLFWDEVVRVEVSMPDGKYFVIDLDGEAGNT